jgi:hypothetical protein
MKIALSVVLILSVCPAWAGPGRELGAGEVSIQADGTPQSAKVNPKPTGPSEKDGKKPLTKIRKILLETEWADDDNARPREVIAIQKHTCLRIVDTLEAADATLSWENQGLMGVALELSSKDGQVLWARRGLTPPLKALKQALGCP